jgi:hypothetical protein
LLRLPEQREREKAKADGVRYHTLDSDGAIHLQEALKMGTGILMRLPIKWVGLHHVYKGRLKLKSGIPQVELGPMATSAVDRAEKSAIDF